MTDEPFDCPRCGESVPDATFCVRCGARLHDGDGPGIGGRAGSYAAAPGESVTQVALFSTLMPQLPVADLDAFRIAFGGGVVALLALVAVGAFPVALVGAAVLVPVLVILYVYSVDVYEDTPLPGLLFTMAWGFAWGIVFAVAIDTLVPTSGRLGGANAGEIVTLGVVVPLLGLAAMVSGPLILLRDRRYNDVVDGATFGVASAVSFVGAQVIAGSVDLFAAGLTPVAEPLPWLGRILAIAVALPVVAAGAVGSAVGAFSLRYRAPIRDRGALGIAGRPGVALILAGALLVAAALAAYLPGPVINVAVQLVLAAVALIWLRRTLHVGLLEEAFEIDIGDEIICANCGKPTRRHTFCGNCGVALHALPKRSGKAGAAVPTATPPAADATASTAAPRSAAGDATTRLTRRGVLIGFALVLGVCLLLAAFAAALIDAPDAPPECPPGTECGGPPPAGDAKTSTVPPAALPAAPAAVPPGTIGIRAGTPWTSTDFGFEFEYPDLWAVDASDGRRADLVFQANADAMLIVAGVPAADASAEAYADRWFDIVQAEAADLRIDNSEKNAILGASIGAVDGVGRTYAGTWTSPQGATTPIGVSLITATDGRTTVAVVLVIWNPDQRLGSTWLQYAVRGTAELSLKTFRWGPTS